MINAKRRGFLDSLTSRRLARLGTKLRFIFRFNTDFPSARPILNFALNPNLAKRLLAEVPMV